MIRERAAFTIAVGKPMYLRMACALARSFRIWHQQSDIRFFIATDADRGSLPSDLQDIDLIAIKPGEFGTGFQPKLHLDKLAPASCSMFIDADCLCVGPLDEAFDTFAGMPVSVIGGKITEGEWGGDVATICARTGAEHLIRFNGGVYYLERGETCSSVYRTARELEPKYDELGFLRLRGCANDEALISVAMSLQSLRPVADRGDIMNSLLAGPGGVAIDVFEGRAVLKNPRGHKKHNPWYPMEEMRPRLVHFLGTELDTYPYRREELRLRQFCQQGWPKAVATLWADVTFSLPWLLLDGLKRVLRPAYHRLFGPRAIRSTRDFSGN